MKKYLTAAVLLITALFLTACGADVKSTVTVNPDESGERQMVLTISKNELKLYGKLSLSEVDSAIADSCPDCMTYAYEENDKEVRATFTLPFSSYEDYENKLNTFCDKDAEVYGRVSASPFAKEIEYSENISSREMLKWLSDALVDRKVINERYRASMFNSFDTKLVINGVAFEGGAGRLSISDNLYCKIDSIDLYTHALGGNKFSRVIKLNIAKEELEKNKDGINDFLKKAVPSNCMGTWESKESDPMQVYSVSMSDLTAEELQSAMEKYTGGHASFDPDAVEATEGIFDRKSGFVESLEWTNYICSSSRTVPIRYVLECKGTKGELIDMAGGAFAKIKGTELKGDDGYLVYDLDERYETAVQVNLEQHYHFSKIDYAIDAKGINDISKEITLHFDNASSEEIGAVCDKIRALGKDDDIAARTQTELSQDSLKLTFTGKAKDINHMMSVISGADEEIGLSYATETKWLVPLEDTIVEDIIDFEGFVYKDPSGSEYWEIPVKYTAKVHGVGREVINDQPLITEKVSSFEGKFTTGNRVRVVYRTKRINGFAFLWYLLLLVAATGLIGGIYFLVRSVIEKKREVKEEMLARQIGVGEAKEIERITDAEVVSEGAEVAEVEEETVAAETVEEAAEEAVEEAAVAETVEEAAEEVAEEAVEENVVEEAPTEKPESEETEVQVDQEADIPAEEVEESATSETIETTEE